MDVPVEFVQQLLDQPSDQVTAARRASDELLDAFVAASKAFEEPERQRKKKRWETLMDRSEARLGRKTAPTLTSRIGSADEMGEWKRCRCLGS